MLLNHDTTRKEIQAIRDAVRSIAKQAETFNNEKGAIVRNADLSDIAKDRKKGEITAIFMQACEGIKGKIETSLDNILAAEQSINNTFNISDTDLQGTIQFIILTEGNMDIETKTKLVDCFKGNRQALLMLASIFETYDIEDKYLQKHIVDIEYYINSRKELAASMTVNPDETAYKIQTLCEDMFKLADLLGIEFTDKERETGLDLDDYYTAMVKSVMGV